MDNIFLVPGRHRTLLYMLGYLTPKRATNKLGGGNQLITVREMQTKQLTTVGVAFCKLELIGNL